MNRNWNAEAQTEPAPEFRLSEPGSAYSAAETEILSYLQSYGLPHPPVVRYGNVLFDSQQPRHRVRLFGQAWLPSHPIGTILFVHGFAEHSANYPQLIHDFVNAHYAVAAFDMRGHGLSEGPRGYTDTPTAYVEDLEQFAKIVFPKLAPSAPLFVWGHSLGAQVCLQAIARAKLPRRPAALVISSPFLGFRRFGDYRDLLLKITPLLARVFPALPISGGVTDADRSSNMAYAESRAEDPLIHGVTTPLWVKNVSIAMEELRNSAAAFRDSTPTLLFLAGDERITNLLAARAFAFSAYSSLRHKVIEFPGMRHELEKEPVRERIVSETLAWFAAHR